MQRYRSVFISDTHLGSKHSKTKELLEFLTEIKNNPPEFIYLVGDIIDGWKLKRSFYWDDSHTLVIRRLLSFIKYGSKIFLIPGNHDSFFRDFIKEYHILEFGHISLSNEFIHNTIDRKKLLIIHGDMFDIAAKYAKWLCILGDWGYETLLNSNHIVNWFRNIFGLQPWSLSQSVKYNVKMAVNHIGDFEKFLIEYGKKKKCDGVVCGHIHHAEIKQIEDFVYYNTGDWIESSTAITENYDGKLELYKHK